VPRTWLISGSSRGVGRALAEAALAAGENVVATARIPDQLRDLGVISLTRAAVPVLREQSSGHILQISSVGGRDTTPGLGPIRRPSGPSRASPECSTGSSLRSGST
jgi:NAD(P)-dependent dehydrogenase (short-subunit alcohol dehydrogenase family)